LYLYDCRIYITLFRKNRKTPVNNFINNIKKLILHNKAKAALKNVKTWHHAVILRNGKVIMGNRRNQIMTLKWKITGKINNQKFKFSIN
jgi:hypothetical protein